MDLVVKSNLFLLSLCLFCACQLPEEKEARARGAQPDTGGVIRTVDTNTATQAIPAEADLPAPQKVRSPQGFYQALLPFNDSTRMEQTVAFYPNHTYRLQEKYSIRNRDSMVIAEGFWSPSDGFIWLYKDQVVRGRYQWKGDTLQYASPGLRKKYSMHLLKDAADIEGRRRSPEVVLYGVGNEPFWNVEVRGRDSLRFEMSGWAEPITIKIDSIYRQGEGMAYSAHGDSAQLKLTVFPYFCSDGMSDYVYRNKVRLQYNNQIYNGCAVTYH